MIPLEVTSDTLGAQGVTQSALQALTVKVDQLKAKTIRVMPLRWEGDDS